MLIHFVCYTGTTAPILPHTVDSPSTIFEDGHGQLFQPLAVPRWIVWIWQDWSRCQSKRACATISAVRQLLFLRLMYKVLSRAETVASSIQRHDLDLYQTQMKLEQLKADVVAMRCDNEFDDFWSDVSEGARLLKVNEPRLQRPRKVPRRLDDNHHHHHHHKRRD